MRTATTILVLLALVFRSHGVSNVIKIGAIFHSGSQEDQMAFERAIEYVRIKHLSGQYILEGVIKHVTVDTDSIETRTKTCELLEEGVAAIFGPKSQVTKPIVASIAARHGIPHIEYSWRPIEESNLEETTINVYPASKSIAKSIASMVEAMPWSRYTAIYQTNDGLSRLQEALKLHGPNDHPVTVRQLGEGPDHRPLLKEIAASMEINILIDVEPDILIEVMKQANEVKLMRDYHSWIVSDLDFPSYPITATFNEAKVNITGFGLLTKKKKELASALGLESVKLEPALLYDAVLLFHRALDTLNLANPSSETPLELEPVSLQCESDDKYPAGQHLTETMRSLPREKRLDEVTGPMEFDETGQRTMFNLQLLEFQTDELIDIGYYDKNGVRLTRSELQREADREKKIQSTHYRVTSRVGAPYLMEAEREDNTTVKIGDKYYMGYGVDLIREISKIRNFTFTFELVPDGNYGSYNDVNKSWDGLIKRLRDHEADLAICDLSINHQREQAVDFTMPFMNLGISILYAKPEVPPQNLFSFLSPFSTEVWIYVATAYLGVSVMLFLLARIAPGEWDNPHPCNPDPEELENSFNLMNSMWLTIGSLMQQGSDILPKAPSIRMVAGMWWFFTLIMVSSYTANLAAFLTTGKMGDTVNNVEELAAQTKIKYGTLEGGSTSMFFKDSNNSVYQRMWAAMNEAKPSVFTKTNKDGVDRVLKGKRGYAFIMESTTIEYNIERECDLAQIGGLLDSKGYGIAMPPKSPYRTAISKAVLELQEKGTLEMLKTRWWKEKNIDKPCEKDEKQDDSSELELRLGNVGGVFLVLLCGCGASLIVGILEFLWNVRKVAVEEKITPWEALVAEFKFAINIWAETKPVKVASSRDSSTAHDGGGIGRAASVARSMVGSFLRLDMLDKFEKDNASNTKSGKRRSK